MICASCYEGIVTGSFYSIIHFKRHSFPKRILETIRVLRVVRAAILSFQGRGIDCYSTLGARSLQQYIVPGFQVSKRVSQTGMVGVQEKGRTEMIESEKLPYNKRLKCQLLFNFGPDDKRGT
ncbi:Hypothetical predicted protein [Podarcis lilfordi]|uniref:Uncharacterized protein n=1 Tax=Podarcis lilfordi TaxID=74358 RepID=A0AA35LGA8_9SAUR|nr:Hypothetical predicted protein [Podarcis lilfordi]